MNETNSLPALLNQRIDALLSSRERVLLAIEGGSASGKTTLASALAACAAHRRATGSARRECGSGAVFIRGAAAASAGAANQVSGL
mgnify:CR=1 FL=1